MGSWKRKRSAEGVPAVEQRNAERVMSIENIRSTITTLEGSLNQLEKKHLEDPKIGERRLAVVRGQIDSLRKIEGKLRELRELSKKK